MALLLIVVVVVDVAAITKTMMTNVSNSVLLPELVRLYDNHRLTGETFDVILCSEWIMFSNVLFVAAPSSVVAFLGFWWRRTVRVPL